jgi:hypothetical protein
MSSRQSVIPDSSDGDFAVEIWRTLVASLRAAEPMFERIAAQNELRLLSSARWPELRLQRRELWTTRELRLTMIPEHADLQSSSPAWAIQVVQYPRFSWLPFGVTSVDRIAQLSDEDLRSEPHLKSLMAKALSFLGALQHSA